MSSATSLIFGYLLGAIVTMIVFKLFSVGSLRIDHSDPIDGPHMYLELDKPIWSVTNKTHVVLRVKNENYISHE